jgi:glycolate oxidase iron-sulfur subunit
MYVKLHPDLSESPAAKEAADIVQSCVHCGFCNATCPTYQDGFDERDGPRGRIYLIKNMLESGQGSDVARTHLDRCLTCRACETTCPSGVQYGRLADIGREMVDEIGERTFPQRFVRRLIRWVFPYSGRIRVLLDLGRFFSPVLPQALRRDIPPRQILDVRPGVPTPSARKMVALQGCVQSAATPRTNHAAQRVLQRLGIDLIEAKAAGCCGAVSYHLGAPDEGLDFMRRNIDAWWPLVEAGAEAIITTASGCGVMVKDYGELLKSDPDYAAKALRISELAKDLSEVLDSEDLSEFTDVTDKSRTAVHCPCTLTHGQKLGGSLQRVLGKVGIPMTKTTEDHLCCGSAGTYSLLQPDMSQRLLKRKLLALTIDDPEQIVTANIGCQLHLGTQSEVPVKHWIELLDEVDPQCSR